MTEHKPLGERFPMTMRVRMVMICLSIVIIATCGAYAAVQGAQAGARGVAAAAIVGVALALLAGCWPGPGWTDGWDRDDQAEAPDAERLHEREAEVEEIRLRNQAAWQRYYDAKDEREARRSQEEA